MYRIMLADDEGIVTDSLKFIIEKNFPDLFEIETAKSGRAVIELAEHFRPDIAFMDIQMPGINGIDAMREIKQTNPSVIFIVLSAYDKFLYAKEAISLGVMEYLNKPVNQKVVVEVIERAIKQIDLRRERHRNDLIIKEKMENVLPVIENGFISSLLFREHFEEDVANYKELLEIDGEHCFMMSIVVGDTQEGNHMTNAVGASVKSHSSYKNICEIVKENLKCYVGTLMSNKIPVCVVTDNNVMEYNERIDLIDKCRKICRKLHDEMESQFRIGIGRIVKLNDAMESYQEALTALINTTGKVAHVEDLPIGCGYEDDYPIDIENKIFEELKLGHEEEFVSACKQFFDWMNMSAGEDNNVRLKVLEFVLRAESDAYRNGGMIYKFTEREDYLPQIMNAANSKDLENWFMNKMTAACRNVVVKKGERNNSIIERSKEYINNNYSKDISLDDISRMMNLSPYYFSKLFKESTGENFVEYMTAVRISEARKLLENPEKSMKEIGSEVGYSDPNYFSRIFKKVVGVTPTEYRESLKG